MNGAKIRLETAPTFTRQSGGRRSSLFADVKTDVDVLAILAYTGVNVLFVDISYRSFQTRPRRERIELVRSSALVFLSALKRTRPFRRQLLNGLFAGLALRRANDAAPTGLVGMAADARIARRAIAPSYCQARFLSKPCSRSSISSDTLRSGTRRVSLYPDERRYRRPPMGLGSNLACSAWSTSRPRRMLRAQMLLRLRLPAWPNGRNELSSENLLRWTPHLWRRRHRCRCRPFSVARASTMDRR